MCQTVALGIKQVSSLKFDKYIASPDLLGIPFAAVPLGDVVMLVARVSAEQADQLFAAGSHLEDLEADGTAEGELGWPETESQSDAEWTDNLDFKE